MTKLQLVLLHSVKFCPEPIWRVIDTHRQVDRHWFPFAFPFEENEEVVIALNELCQRKLLALFNWKDHEEQVPIESPTPEIIRNSFDIKSIYYCLTPEGGACWEHIFKPDWSKYVAKSFSGRNVNGIDVLDVWITSALRENLDMLIESDYSPGYIEVEPEDREIETLEEWEVFYWKTLPVGYQTNCWFRSKPASELPQNFKFDMSAIWRNWYDKTIVGF